MSRFALGLAVAGAAVESSFTDSATSGADASSYSFTGRSVGAAHASRRVIVGVVVRSDTSGTARTISSVTIGGVSATLLGQASAPASGFPGTVAFYVARLPSGTTADIDVVASGGCLRAAIVVYRVVGGEDSVAAVDNQNQTSGTSVTSLSVSINSPTRGAIFALCVQGGGGSNPADMSWTGVTEAGDNTIESAGTRYSTAKLDTAAAQSGLSVSVSATANSGNMTYALLAVSIR